GIQHAKRESRRVDGSAKYGNRSIPKRVRPRIRAGSWENVRYKRRRRPEEPTRKALMRHKIITNIGAGIACAVIGSVCLAQPDMEGIPGPDLPLFSGLDPSPEAAPVPELELTGELLFQILAADIAAQRGSWPAAINTGLQLARATRDYRLARRALEYALAGNDLPRAWEAARLWVELAPHDPQAQQTELMLAAANGHTENLAKALRQQIDAADDKGMAIIQ